MRYLIALKHDKNPDIHGGYWEQPLDPKSCHGLADTLEAARAVFVAWRNRNKLGGGNMTTHSGRVTDTDTGRVVGWFSYNARLWAQPWWKADYESEIDVATGTRMKGQKP